MHCKRILLALDLETPSDAHRGLSYKVSTDTFVQLIYLSVYGLIASGVITPKGKAVPIGEN